jgi:hypothetical protein
VDRLAQRFRQAVWLKPTLRGSDSRGLENREWVATVPISASGQTLVDPAATSEPFLFYQAVAEP